MPPVTQSLGGSGDLSSASLSSQQWDRQRLTVLREPGPWLAHEGSSGLQDEAAAGTVTPSSLGQIAPASRLRPRLRFP